MAREVKDPYAMAQFSSLWSVVTHATDPDEDRQAKYREAWQAMVSEGRWGEYIMQYHTLQSGHRLHVGYRYANPKDWFTLEEGEIDGPFPSKKLILHKHRVKASKTLGTGQYQVTNTVVAFTRDQAEAVGLQQEELP